MKTKNSLTIWKTLAVLAAMALLAWTAGQQAIAKENPFGFAAPAAEWVQIGRAHV